MGKKHGMLVTAALAGFIIATGANAEGKKKAAAPAKAETGECHGINECKGKGECGGDGHACGGKNECKGKGWVKMSKADCEAKKGTFKAGGGDHHGHSH